MIRVEIKDCQQAQVLTGHPTVHRHEDVVQLAVSLLNDRLCSGLDANVSYLSLTGRTATHRPEFVIGCRAGSVSAAKSFSHTTELVFSSSTYVGQAVQNVPLNGGRSECVRIDIIPHIGEALDAYLIGHACGVLLPHGMTARAKGSSTRNNWLLALMWRSAFEKARRESFLPKNYRVCRTNGRTFRGRLDVARQIRENLADATRIACVYNEFSADTIINRTIRRVRNWYVEHGLSSCGLGDVDELDQRLASMGVPLSEVMPDQIDRIVYTRMTEAYRPVMRLSKLMLGVSGGSEQTLGLGAETAAYFVDYSEVWENYLMSVMRRALGDRYTFVSPNDIGADEKLVECGRMVRPDFLVYNKDRRLIAVLDAKYKNISRIGSTGSQLGNVSRDDLYQMMTYLYHYSGDGKPLSGVFLTCGDDVGEGMQNVAGRSSHRIGVCPFPLSGVDTSECCDASKVECEMSRRAVDFCRRLEVCLGGG